MKQLPAQRHALGSLHSEFGAGPTKASFASFRIHPNRDDVAKRLTCLTLYGGDAQPRSEATESEQIGVCRPLSTIEKCLVFEKAGEHLCAIPFRCTAENGAHRGGKALRPEPRGRRLKGGTTPLPMLTRLGKERLYLHRIAQRRAVKSFRHWARIAEAAGRTSVTLLVRFEQPQMVAEAREIFSAALQHSEAVELAAWKHSRGLWTRIKERCAYFFLARIDPHVARQQWKALPD